MIYRFGPIGKPSGYDLDLGSQILVTVIQKLRVIFLEPGLSSLQPSGWLYKLYTVNFQICKQVQYLKLCGLQMMMKVALLFSISFVSAQKGVGPADPNSIEVVHVVSMSHLDALTLTLTLTLTSSRLFTWCQCRTSMPGTSTPSWHRWPPSGPCTGYHR